MANHKLHSSAAMVLAAASLGLTPASAAQLPSVPHGSQMRYHEQNIAAWDQDSLNADRYRRGHRHGVDGGDIIGGIIVLGTIAAIASAVSNSAPRRTAAPPSRDYPQSYPQSYQAPSRSGGNSGLNGAVDSCLGAIERDVRVNEVDEVARAGSGWTVIGTIYNGDRFTCNVDDRGQIRNIDYGQNRGAYRGSYNGGGYSGGGYSGGGYSGGNTPNSASADNQWADEAYADARRNMPPAYPSGG